MSDVIDCRGLACPQPVLQTKDILETTNLDRFTVIVDNEAAKNNVSRFVTSQGNQVTVEEGDGVYRLHITRSAASAPADLAGIETVTRPITQEPNLVIKIPADKMGRGDDELGRILLMAFVKTIKDISPLPKKIILFNAGVKLAVSGSDVLDALQDLAKSGIEILVCGTCLDYFNLKQDLEVGTVSNMFEIMSTLAQADRVISP
jgi:selenium metabolism protein YedF